MSKSVEELFKDAPNGATHYNSANQMFYRFSGGRGEVFHFSFMDWQDASALHEYGSLMIERPQTKPWSGPEDGLPPAGTVCEVKGCMSHYLKWNKVTVFAVRDKTVMFDMEDGRWGQTESHEFRAIQTQEQLRETAIRELMDIAQVDCRVTAARLVDAGFKREVV